MKAKSLNIIIVGYNEESNLPKCFEHLQYLQSKLDCRVIYIDQSSDDNSAEIARKNEAEVYVHENKWYADPDKKWAVETLCSDGDWCMILDCDEEVSDKLADKITLIVEENKNNYCYSVVRNTFWMGIVIAKTDQLRLFKKQSIEITDKIHNYINPKKDYTHIKLKEHLDEIDLKFKQQEVFFFADKLNKYSTIEANQFFEEKNYNKATIVFNLIRKPILRFFGHGIVHKQFLRGIPWLMVCKMMAQYQWMIYAKLYEKKYIYYK